MTTPGWRDGCMDCCVDGCVGGGCSCRGVERGDVDGGDGERIEFGGGGDAWVSFVDSPVRLGIDVPHIHCWWWG